MSLSPQRSFDGFDGSLMGNIDDEVVEFRFPDIDLETQELITDVITEEFEDGAEEVVLTKPASKGEAQATSNDRNGPSRQSGFRLSKGNDGNQSVLSVRPSLISFGMSDRFLEKVINQTSERSFKSTDSPQPKSRSSNGQSLQSLGPGASNLESLTAYSANDDGRLSIASSMLTGRTLSSRFSLAPSVGSHSERRISIVADPVLFGQGGAPISFDGTPTEHFEKSMDLAIDPLIFENVEKNNFGDSMGPPPSKKPYGMQFSVSRGTLALLDEEFSDDSSFSSEHDNMMEPINPLPVVNEATRQPYWNETNETLKAQEEALAREAAKISFEDKTRVNFEVHGIPHMGNVDPELENIDWYLQQLEVELQSITHQNDAVREAQQMNPKSVNSKEFRLMFLRMFLQGGAFDVKQAAAKMAFYFDTKKLIFGGGEILGRDVRLSDLSVGDRAAMNSGAWQVMPDRDAAGRVVVFYAPGQRVFETVENWLRPLWYMLSLIAKDEVNQKSGVVMVRYLRGFTTLRDTYEEAKKVAMVRDAIPQKYAALHYCYNDESMTALVTAQKIHFLTRNQRSHTREHLASHDEICFRLETYGIHVDRTILLENGHLGMAWYNEWIQLREATETEVQPIGSGSAKSTIETTVVPSNFDVLFGRGRNTREHCGNLRCAVLVEMHQKEYESCSKTEKTAIAERIIKMVKECGGKFLKKDRKYGWQEVPDNKAREKVAHFFRHLRAMDKSKDNDDSDCGITESQKRALPS
mmetsp:Transcript_594/g.1427  ORF Transcript_594/g.1427 Transcript_594/m.1427 type:complete len:752 (+) Transcript_594:258-2513(+)